MTSPGVAAEQELVSQVLASEGVRIQVRARGTGAAFGVDLSLSRWGMHGAVGPVRPDGSVEPVQSLYRNDHDVRAILRQAIAAAGGPLLLGTLEVSARKAKASSKELRALAHTLLAELTGQAPDEATLEAHRKQLKADKAAEKAVREAAKAKQAARDEARRKDEIAARTPDAPVTDVPSFLAALEVRLSDRSRIAKAKSMLKKDGFRLYSDVRDDEVAGVVKSQSDPDLVYACRLRSDGTLTCCTQNLNVCGGLRGEACKHLLVLLIGLVQAGELDPRRVDGWLEATLGKKPVLDRDHMGDVFLRYRGAEAGEVDWRPTETVPEDFYAF